MTRTVRPIDEGRRERRRRDEAWLHSRAASIDGGSARIQRNVIGKPVLGLPAEPRP